MQKIDAFGNEMSDGELVADHIRALHDDLQQTGAATGDFLENISSKVDSIDETGRGIHFDVISAAQKRDAMLAQLVQIKWLLAALLLLLLWRLL